MYGQIKNRRCRRSKPDRSTAGFSLIELLLVLVILATLTAIVVPKFTGRSEQARVTTTKADISNIELALDSFEVDCGRYPTTEEELKALIDRPANVKEEHWHGEYLKRGIPKDPWGNPYVYRQPGRHNTNSYDLYSFGPDGQEGGGDDIDNWSER